MHPLPPKKEVALALLERSSIFVHLDPRGAAVIVPPWFKKQAQLVLQVGLNMPVPIPDLRLDDEGMSCTLSFNRAPFYCVVPWGSVFAMVGDDGRGMVWPDDVPAELTATAPTAEPKRPTRRGEAKGESKGDATKAKRSRKKKEDARRPSLAAVPKAAESKPAPLPAPASKPAPEPSPAPPAPAPRAGSKPKRELPPYLRVVK